VRGERKRGKKCAAKKLYELEKFVREREKRCFFYSAFLSLGKEMTFFKSCVFFFIMKRKFALKLYSWRSSSKENNISLLLFQLPVAFFRLIFLIIDIVLDL
jgi:hypothetical protein